ncbi:MAG: DUF4430 domain-containing protein [Clostridia bacterium]|nr:DUF4430 domain-containing protein [Clostridia bacterium]
MKKSVLQLSSLFLCILLIAASALCITSCTSVPEAEKEPVTFSVTVVFEDGQKETKTLTTEKSTVGDALLEAGIIEGDEGLYGLYVKKVLGVFAEYETTGTYWAFYIDGEYAPTGVEMTAIDPEKTYELRVEKA